MLPCSIRPPLPRRNLITYIRLLTTCNSPPHHLSSSYSTTPPTNSPPLSILPTTSSTTPLHSASHNSLSTFLVHAHRTSLSPTSTVYLGTHYEYTVLHSLTRLGLSLTRTGGASDRGIDLLGKWWLPSLSSNGQDLESLRVIVQCKAFTGKGRIGPSLIRELEGAFAGVPRRWREALQKTEAVDNRVVEDEHLVEHERKQTCDHEQTQHKEPASPNTNNTTHPIIGLLAAPTPATKGVRDALSRSRWPMGYAKISLDGRIEQLLWNKNAAERGLEGMSVTIRHLPRKAMDDQGKGGGGGDGGLEKEEVEVGVGMLSEVALMWKGKAWECTEEKVKAWDEGEATAA